jgi:hypothetical protein
VRLVSLVTSLESGGSNPNYRRTFALIAVAYHHAHIPRRADVAGASALASRQLRIADGATELLADDPISLDNNRR